MAPVVVLYGLLLGAPRHHIVIELTPLRTGKKRGEEGGIAGEGRETET